MLHTNHLFFAYLTIVHSLRGDREHAAEQLIQDGVPAQLDVGRNRHARRDMEIRRRVAQAHPFDRGARTNGAVLLGGAESMGACLRRPPPGRWVRSWCSAPRSAPPGRLFTSVAGDGVAPNAVHPPLEETIRREIERFDLDLRVLLGEDKQTRCRGPTPLPRSRVRCHAVRRRQAAARASPLLRSYAPRADERPRPLARSESAAWPCVRP
jgi:hypothetical protein